ncbi:segregation/condensation protein A [Halorubellus sp. JP-L1]|uniref:segregation/condensation protein A n=1 Tax=Halorubellus sp. JP-L1 TaxID=2715753 RepID=UPI00140BD2E5|nr:ScpA family protein [Halorubellus sp. JP-L1]NHN42283.1 segregation/condensation protein A [Halorubellus sp. JP-L1]
MTEGSAGNGGGEEVRSDGGEADPASMLDIAGHEDRDPPGEEDSPFGDDALDDDGSDEDVAGEDGDGEDPYPDAAEAADAATETMDEVLPDEDDVAEGDDEEVEPVEVLVNLAENGEIDPWDIDVVTVTDKFLDALDHADLRTSGRALFYASVLVRMKGDELLHGSDDDDEDELAPWEEPFADAPAGGMADGEQPSEFDPVAALEDEMERRLDRKNARGTPETLDELVRELREAERGSWWKRQREYDTSDSPSGYGRGEQTLDYRSADDLRVDDEPTEADVTGTTHEEDIESVIEDVETTLREHYDAGRDEVLFKEVAAAYGSRVQTFLAVLFMSHRGTVRLQQDELFGDLWVQDPNAATARESAAAD